MNDLKFHDRHIKLFFNVISTLGGENRQDMMMPILQDLMESTLLQLSDHTFIYINPNDMIIRIIIFILITVKSIRSMAISLKPMLVCEQKLTFRFLARLDYDLK